MNRKLEGFILLLITACATSLAACSTAGTSVLIGESRFGATPSESVVLLITTPTRQHEVIALVEGVAATDDYFTKAKTEAAAIAALKKEAARIGANAVVLTGKGSAPYGQVTVGSTTGGAYGTSYGNAVNVSGYATTVASSLGWEKITFSGTAIRYTDNP